MFMIVVVYICELSLCADGAAKQIPLLSCQLVAWILVYTSHKHVQTRFACVLLTNQSIKHAAACAFTTKRGTLGSAVIDNSKSEQWFSIW